MHSLKKYILATFLLLLLSPCTVYATSSMISSVTRLDTSEGSIKGDNLEYSFVLPKSWQNGTVTVNRERPSRGLQYLDKLIFLYIPQDKISKPVIFATLYVYDSSPETNLGPYRKLLETNRYVFMFDSATRNNFSDVADRTTFGQLINSAGNDSMMASQIDVPKSQRKVTANTVTVNGRLLKDSSIQNITGTVYIPVREACNALGYSVEWNAADSSITIHSGSERYVLSTPQSPFRENYSTILMNNKAYVTSVFFMRALNANIEVDGSNNVVISTEG